MQVSIITGGGSGIGAAVARRAGTRGFDQQFRRACEISWW
jgi:NAD(P)-dependent dehydrogenase (short-subunit alcohol dehydrogenase family)